MSSLPMTASVRTKSAQGKLSCEMCQNQGLDIFVCNICYSFCCAPCRPLHHCPNDQENHPKEGRFEKIEVKAYRPVELRKKRSEEAKGKAGEGNDNKKEWILSCQRCFVQTAARECCQCKIKYYCQPCFKSIHFSLKLSVHQCVIIKQNEEKILNVENCPSRLKIKMPSVKEVNKIHVGMSQIIQSKNEEAIKGIEASAQIIQSTLLLEHTNHENEINEAIKTITTHFEDLIEQIRLKLIQITEQIKEESKSNKSNYDKIKKTLSQTFSNLSNIRQISKKDSNFILKPQILNIKIQKSSKLINDIAISEQYVNIRQPFYHSYAETYQQIDEIKKRVSKIQLKIKSCSQIQGNKTLSISTHSHEKINHPIHKTQSKTLKNFFTLDSYKSIEKAVTSPFILTSPKKGEHKLHKQSINASTKSLFVEQNNFNSPQEKLIKSPGSKKYLNLNNISQPQQKKKTGPSKDRPALTKVISPKASMKRFDKNLQNFGKLNMVKAGINIEKTKKMIKQIRNEMVQFTNRYNMDKQLSQSHQSQSKSQFGNISELSLESLTGRTSKE